MLADTLMLNNDPSAWRMYLGPAGVTGLRDTQMAVKNSERFMIADDFLSAAKDMVIDRTFEGMEPLSPFMQPPFDNTWIEYRLGAMRVGWWIGASDGGFTARMIYDIEKEGVAPSPNVCCIVFRKGSWPFEIYRVGDFQAEFFARVPEVAKSLEREDRLETEAQGYILCGLILLMNTRNAPETSRIVRPLKPNLRRTARGKPPLLDYTVTRLSARVSPCTPPSEAQEGIRGAARLHSVRGHFKVKKSGLFWWSNHLRGGGAGGAVERRHYAIG